MDRLEFATELFSSLFLIVLAHTNFQEWLLGFMRLLVFILECRCWASLLSLLGFITVHHCFPIAYRAHEPLLARACTVPTHPNGLHITVSNFVPVSSTSVPLVRVRTKHKQRP
jgi:hypothetical protein